MPKVSVLMPVYNSELFLVEAIDSVLSQTFQDFELIIVDNDSTDKSYDIIQKYKSDNRVQIYKNNVNIGMARNWNQCLLYATGKYIKFLCSDDRLYPEALSNFVNVLDNNPTVSLVTSYRHIASTELTEFRLPFSGLQPGLKIIEESLITHNWIGEPSSVMFRRKDLNVGFFKTDLRWLIDWDLWLRLLTVGDCFIIPKILSFFRLHSEQGTVHIKNRFLDKFEEYYFLKSIRDFNLFKIGHQNHRFNKRLNEKAYDCGKAIPYLRSNKENELAINAIAILKETRLFWSYLFWCFTNARKTIPWFLYNYVRH